MGSNQKPFGEVDRLASIVTSPDFDIGQLAGFSASGASCFFDWSENQEDKGPYTGDTWCETPIEINIPLGSKSTLGLTQIFSVPGLHY